MRYFLIILVFVSGITSLALEMCASRLLAAYFGTSLFIWANLIGMILLYLTVGYFIGGRLADRNPSEQVLCTITALAALSISILPFISQGILTWSITGLAQASVSIFFSSLLGTILLFAVPVTWHGLTFRDPPRDKRYWQKREDKRFTLRFIHSWRYPGCVSTCLVAHPDFWRAPHLAHSRRDTFCGFTMGA